MKLAPNKIQLFYYLEDGLKDKSVESSYFIDQAQQKT